MILSVDISGKSYGVDLAQPHSLAIPVDFTGPQPRFFEAPRAVAQPFKKGDFVGATKEGGSCNVSAIHLVPHCNGTHTESVGHIVDAPIPVHDSATQSLVPATLVTVTPVSAEACRESYRPEPLTSDTLVTRLLLERLLDNFTEEETTALVVRTNPNDSSKKNRDYGAGPIPPYFSAEAMRYIAERGVTHLLVDMPSVDRMWDEGRTTNHRTFWNVADDSHVLSSSDRTKSTITEMIYVDDAIADGLYLLNLQLPAFLSDAAPSRPVLYPLAEVVQ